MQKPIYTFIVALTLQGPAHPFLCLVITWLSRPAIMVIRVRERMNIAFRCYCPIWRRILDLFSANVPFYDRVIIEILLLVEKLENFSSC